MKILMLTDAVGRGGRERRMLELIRDLPLEDPAVDILLLSLSSRVEYDELYHLPLRFEILRRRPGFDPRLVTRLAGIIRDYRPDVIHSWGSLSSLYVAFANLFARVPLVNGIVAGATPNLDWRDKVYRRVRLTQPFTDVFVANSYAGIKAYRTPPERSVCIYNGINFGRFERLAAPAAIERQLLGSRKGGRFVAVMVASFETTKDYPTLIEAAVRTCRSEDDIVYLLVGQGSLLPSIKARVPKDLIGTRIIFTGQRDDVESIVQIADAGLLITEAEGISNAILEYMALGKPVIATGVGGTAEVIWDRYNGFLVEPHNAAQVAERILELKRDRTLAATMGRNGHDLCHRRFDVRGKSLEYLDLYRRAIEAHAPWRRKFAGWA